MTKTGQFRAVKVLLDKNGVLGEEHRLPKVYVVGDEVCIFLTAALRYQRNHFYLNNGEKLSIETLTIEEAYRLLNTGEELPKNIKNMVDWNFDSIGSTYKHEDWYPWQIAMYNNDPHISPIFCRV